MAETFTLSDAYGSIDLNVINPNSTGGLRVMFGNTHQRAPDPQGRVIETYKCKVKGTSDDNLSTQLIKLNQMLENAARYDADSTEENEVWLNDQLKGETNQRRSLVLGGAWQYDVSPHDVPTPTQHEALITLAIKRMPAWESAPTYVDTQTGVSLMGGAVDLSARNNGDMPGRVYIGLQYNTGAIDTIWCGFRSVRKHKVTNFVPIWEVEKGTLGTDTTTTAFYDSTATGTTPKALLCSFATNAGWVERFKISVANVSPTHPEEQSGRFLVLGRMKLDGGTDVIQVRLRSGAILSYLTPQYKVLDPVTISGYDFRYYELGTVKFPPMFGFGLTAQAMTNCTLSLLASRVSGSTSQLVVDHFALCPVDEGFAKLSSLALASTARLVTISETPKNTVMTTFQDPNGTIASFPLSQHGFYAPFSASSLFVFGQRLAQSVIGDSVDVLSRIYTRFYSLRGTA